MKRSEYYYKKVLRKIIQLFLQGLLLIAPISITIFVIFKLFEFVDGLIPLRIPGLGLLLIFTFITLAGLFGTLIIRTPFNILFNRIMDQVPLVKMLYTAISDLLSGFCRSEEKIYRTGYGNYE